MTGWSVKEWWKLSQKEFEAAQLANPRGQGISTGGSVVHHPHRTLLGAQLELRRVLRNPTEDYYTDAKIVDHDAEMRRWGRFDFIKNPTAADLERMAERRPAVDSREFPLQEHAPDEAVKVVAFGLHKPRPRILNEDTRSGFVILGGVAGFLLLVVCAVVALIAYGVTHS